MKLKTNFKKIISVFILIVTFSLIFSGNITYGKTNTVYKTSGEVGSIDVDQAVSDAPVLDAIAHVVYAVAGFIENIVGSLVSIFTGTKIFPWADRVIFNTMPLLDINFLSPEPGSMFADLSGTTTDLGKIVQNIYYTIFGLSVTFFGVVVGVMALKLAISSIAAEKAKYKQAITNWLVALIMLFTVHYLMSFIFFVNEKMVEVASEVISSQKLDFSIDISGMSRDDKNEVIKAILSSTSFDYSEARYPVSTYEDKYSLIFCDVNEEYDLGYFSGSFDKLPSSGKVFSVAWEGEYWGGKNEWKIHEFENKYDWETQVDDGRVSKDSPTGGLHEQWITIICELLANPSYSATINLKDAEEVYAMAYEAAYILLLDKYHNEVLNDEKKFKIGIKNIANYVNSFVEFTDTFDFGDEEDLDENVEALWNFANMKYGDGASTGEYKKQVFTGMADFFKSAVTAVSLFEDEEGETEVDNFNPIPAILYSIFVIQSIMYFIAYLKRFFYILVLALFAPLVIIYDFLTKTAMG